MPGGPKGEMDGGVRSSGVAGISYQENSGGYRRGMETSQVHRAGKEGCPFGSSALSMPAKRSKESAAGAKKGTFTRRPQDHEGKLSGKGAAQDASSTDEPSDTVAKHSSGGIKGELENSWS